MQSAEIVTKEAEHTRDVPTSGTVIHNWPCRNPPKATLILQHGFADYGERHIKAYKFFRPGLHNLDIDVWAMDAWGHGSSPGKRSVCHTGKAVQDHIELRQKLAGPGRPPLYIMGHSWGGLISAGSATEAPNDLAGVILLAPALADPMTPLARRAIGGLARIMPSRQILLPGAPDDTLSHDANYVEKWKADPNVFHGQISYLLAATALQTALKMWDHTVEWTIPTLVIHGDKDTFTAHEQSRVFVDSIRSSDKAFLSVKDGFHDLFSDTESAAIWNLVEAWLRQRVGDRSNP